MKPLPTSDKRRYRYSLILLRQLVVSDFKLRYQGSVLGYVWTLLRPLLLFAILYLVFVQVLRFGDDVPHFPVYLLVGIVLWNFFAETTNNSVKAIVEKQEILRKINFPKHVIILAGALSALINLAFNFVVVAVFIVVAGVDLQLNALLTPLYILELFVFGLALSFLLSALYVRIRDLNYVWEVIMQALFYASPIIYPLSMVHERWPQLTSILLWNPVAQIIQDTRYILVTDRTDTLAQLSGPLAMLIPVGVIVGVVIVAAVIFKKRAPYFAEDV